MNLKKTFTILDFADGSISAVVAEKLEKGGFRLLAMARADAKGIEKGGISHLGDAVESVTRALQAVEDRSGLKVESLYYNFDDPFIKSVRCRGAKTLKGEGQIRFPDIEEACFAARRLAGDFERSVIYEASVDFFIDGHDRLDDPEGVFGSRLEVEMHFLLVRAAHREDWRNVFRRAQVGDAWPVVSALSAAYGMASMAQRQAGFVGLDLRRDLAGLFAFQRNKLMECKALPFEGGNPKKTPEDYAAAARELLGRHGAAQRMYVCGGSDAHFLEALGAAAGCPVEAAAPVSGIAEIDVPRHARLAGLLLVADELKSKEPILRRSKGFLSGARQKAAAFINEYF